MIHADIDVNLQSLTVSYSEKMIQSGANSDLEAKHAPTYYCMQWRWAQLCLLCIKDEAQRSKG